LHRYSGLKQRMIAERFGGLDEGLVSRDRRAIQEKIETEQKIRKWGPPLGYCFVRGINRQKSISIKSPGAIESRTSAILAVFFWITGQLVVGKTTIAIWRFVRFCWYFKR